VAQHGRIDIVLKDSLSAEQSTGHAPPRSHSRALAAFSIFAAIAAGAAIYFWHGQERAIVQLTAERVQAAHAQWSFKASRDAIDTVVSNLADSLRNPAGIQAAEIEAILAKAETTIGTLATKVQNDPDLQRSQASMYVQFSATYLALGDMSRAVDSARKGTEIFRALAAADPKNNNMQSNLGLSLENLGEALRASGDVDGALAADRESLDIARAVADKEPANKQFRTDVVLALWRLASVRDNPREHLIEALLILKNLKLAAMLTPAQEEWIGTIEGELSRLR
jgi:hypothetical protein